MWITTSTSVLRSLNPSLRNSQVQSLTFVWFSRLFGDAHVFNACHVRVLSEGVAPPAEFEEEFVADPNGETLALYAAMQPLLLQTMTKSKDGFLGVKPHHLHRVLTRRTRYTLVTFLFH